VAVQLDGALACVTGGARGIGRETAAALAAGGARVWIGDTDADEAATAAAEIEGEVHSAHLDVTDPASFAAFLEAAEADGENVDILVNNAGIMPLGSFLDQDQQLSDRIIDVNLRGVISGMRLALPGMVERGRGHVANVASMMAKLAVPGAAVYTATKHAVLGLSDTVREEIAGSGVTISVILPSAVRTGLVAGVPLGRGLPLVEPEDVAEAIVASCANGRHEVFVPRWLGGYDAATAALPGRVMGAVRRLLDHDRVLTRLDRDARREYDSRI
jgi:NADP-dependent 3-hydroxy acid dehydrogenase YdfG